MVDYVLPDEYPYKDVGEPGAEPLRSADYNPLLAAVADLGAAGGRVAALEGNPILNADTTGAAVGQVVAVAVASGGDASGFGLVGDIARRLIHNGTAYPARPVGAAAGLVEYIGPTEPVDWLDGDTWVQTA